MVEKKISRWLNEIDVEIDHLKQLRAKVLNLEESKPMIEPEPEYTIPFTGNRYCGPAALAYVMRSDPDSAARLLREVSGKSSIKGTATRHMTSALTKLNKKFEFDWQRGKEPTLEQWMQTSPKGEYIVLIPGHYIIIDHDRYFDSMCHLGKPHSKNPYMRRRVKYTWRIL